MAVNDTKAAVPSPTPNDSAPITKASRQASCGWFAKQIWDAVQELKRDVHEIEVDLPRSYVSKNDFHETMRHIEDMFQRIYDKLDGKVDK